MNVEHPRHPHTRPFSGPATDAPAPVDGRARPLTVERIPFLEAVAADVAAPAVACGGRRRLGAGDVPARLAADADAGEG
ncbi:hypothetical protein [Kitasatospora sp. NPDC057223]|uniref:hypothetical protein n=1 Tax=Kitasatospora sp. NPDC057223 TaxID=3346055 RepID=UPI0036299875